MTNKAIIAALSIPTVCALVILFKNTKQPATIPVPKTHMQSAGFTTHASLGAAIEKQSSKAAEKISASLKSLKKK